MSVRKVNTRQVASVTSKEDLATTLLREIDLASVPLQKAQQLGKLLHRYPEQSLYSLCVMYLLTI